ncbi:MULTISPECIES: MFS transporter [Herbaspirillum]|uniref:MHS family proline/betaine transporter-like MFS transporter n=1 Tax=Herbaspirillum frisingense TaxID=92645 RepID=A0ABU1PG95_9BURK|nr:MULTISPECIES: MFS transporter [Herbaspirillum]MDR6584368.1 MHS family proline/betaine transporter-like MFS transporter [Herbaspirillum frisingense]QNB09421.1 MFS transporter [Herbaspirillum frisingense]
MNAASPSAAQEVSPSAHSEPAPMSAARTRRLIIASSIGNALEWFDFVAYGFFAVTISKLFFPTGDDTVSLLVTFATFGLSYLFRPLGAILLGWYGDKVGRKPALLVSLSMTVVGTLICTVIPTYESIGVAAPIGILVARILLALSAGGEFGSATALLTETGSKRRAFMASWQFSSQGAAALMAALAGFLLNLWLTPEQISAWGWRLPFAFGLLIAPVGLYIRRHIDEVPMAKKAQASQADDASWGLQVTRVLVAMGILSVSTAATYLMLLYMPTFAIKQLHLPQSTAFAAAAVTGAILMVGAPFMGLLADRYGRTRIMVVSTVLTLATIYGSFVWVIAQPSVWVMMAIMIWAGILKAVYFGSLGVVLSSIFPPATRVRGMGISYSLGATVFGGFTPFMVTWLVGKTGNPVSPSYYLMGCAAISLVCVSIYHLRLKKYL